MAWSASAGTKAEPGLAPVFVRVSFLEGTLDVPLKVQLTLRGKRLLPQEVKSGRTTRVWSVPFFQKARICVVSLPKQAALFPPRCASFTGGERGGTKATPITFLLGMRKEIAAPPKPKPAAEQLVSVSAQLNCVGGGFGKLRLETAVEGGLSPDIQCGELVQAALASAKTQGRICLASIPQGIRLTSVQCADVTAGVTAGPVIFSLERERRIEVSPPPTPAQPQPPPQSQPPPSTQPPPPQARALTVGVSGSGSVSSNPSGVNCPGDCAETYPAGTLITLTAAPASGWKLESWSGGGCSGSSSSCVVTLDEGKSVSATFTQTPPPPPPQSRTLTVSVTGSGSVSSSPPGVSCPGDCSETYPEGTSVTLTAAPASGWKFSGWGGACSGVTLSCSIAMESDRAVTATFQEEVSGPPPEPGG